jgi:hypothetical protein
MAFTPHWLGNSTHHGNQQCSFFVLDFMALTAKSCRGVVIATLTLRVRKLAYSLEPQRMVPGL